MPAEKPAADVDSVVASVDQIAALPDITMRIVQAVDDPRSSALQLLKLVSHDPALAAKILRIVNSSFYGMSAEITSLERAIALMGLRTIRNLAVASSMSSLFRGGELCPGHTPRDLWMHSIAVAVCARDLAREMRLPMVDEAFLVGLLHDVGLLLIHQQFPGELRDICEQSRSGGQPLCELEREMFGFDHPRLGGTLAVKWKFPAMAVAAILYHHNPQDAPVEYRPLTALVYAADTIACQAGEGFALTASGQSLDDDLLALAPVSREVVERTRGNLKELMQIASPFTE